MFILFVACLLVADVFILSVIGDRSSCVRVKCVRVDDVCVSVCVRKCIV